MRIVQTVFGVFHHFDLARELNRRGHLECIYSTFPWQRLAREGLSRDRVETFPWLHLGELLAGRVGSKLGLNLRWLADELGYRNALAFDQWTDGRVKRLLDGGVSIDALVGISGSSLRTGARVQEAGGLFVCDRGSTHQRYQEYVVAEELTRWGVQQSPSDERDTVREEEIYAQADAITVPSSMAKRSFVGMGVPTEKLHVIPYGVRLDAFQPATDPGQGPDADRFTVLFAGAVGLRKGIPYLLQAFAKLRHPGKRLVLAGALQDDLRCCLPRLPKEDVEFIGSRGRSGLASLMRSSDVLVLPSIEDGFGLVVPEALACGCPVICADTAGAADMVTPGLNGFVFPSRNVAALTGYLQNLADDVELRTRMRQAAVDSTAKIGGWEQYGDRWEALLKDLTTA